MANPRCANIACNELANIEALFCSFLCRCYWGYQAAHTAGEESYYHKLWLKEHREKFPECGNCTPHIHVKELFEER